MFGSVKLWSVWSKLSACKNLSYKRLQYFFYVLRTYSMELWISILQVITWLDAFHSVIFQTITYSKKRESTHCLNRFIRSIIWLISTVQPNTRLVLVLSPDKHQSIIGINSILNPIIIRQFYHWFFTFYFACFLNDWSFYQKPGLHSNFKSNHSIV